MVRLILAAGIVCAVATPSWAAMNVVCDNGLRCIMAPCPSTNAYDVRSKKLRKGIWVDIAGMPATERREIERSEGLYRGTLVISGRFEQRTVKGPAGERSLPFLVGEHIERKATLREQRMCKG